MRFSQFSEHYGAVPFNVVYGADTQFSSIDTHGHWWWSGILFLSGFSEWGTEPTSSTKQTCSLIRVPESQR